MTSQDPIRRGAMSWHQVLRLLPRRANAGSGMYDERIPGRPERVGWRIYFSGGSFRAEDQDGQPVWIVRSDGVTYFGFDEGVPWRSAPEEGAWSIQEPVKWALSMLRPSALGSFLDLEGWTFDVEPDQGGIRAVQMYGPDGRHTTMSVDLQRGLVTAIWAPAEPATVCRIRDWAEAPQPHALFRWEGPSRDSRIEG